LVGELKKPQRRKRGWGKEQRERVEKKESDEG